MALSKIDVCNQALLRVGADTIASLDTSSNLDEGTVREANLCNIFFDQALEETMRIYPWNCCTERAIPVKLADDPLFGYESAFQLPNDCMRVINVFDSEDQNKNGIRWVVEGNKVLCDYQIIYLKYVKKPTNVGELDSLAVRALICSLALKLAIPLQLSDTTAARILAELEQVVLPAARSIDTIENKELLSEESTWITSRYQDRPNY